MDKYCYICGRRTILHRHHIYGGSLRNTSEKHGAVVNLCADCHTIDRHAVHNDPDMKLWLQRTWQREFEKTHTRDEFIKIFGRSFLDD